MIGCDGPCQNWYHYECLGIDQSQIVEADPYFCPECSKIKGAAIQK